MRKKPNDKKAMGGKKTFRKKAKKVFHRFMLGLAACACLFGTGYFFGIHHRVVEAWLRGTEMPTPPEGHHCR